jgi:general secretion pathway protein K
MIRQRDGYALIAALWVVVMFSAVMLELSLRSRDRRLSAGNLAGEIRTRAAADAGLAHVHALLQNRLLSSTDPAAHSVEKRFDPWARLIYVVPDTVTLGEARYVISLRDAGSALNVNRATGQELLRFFTALRTDAGEAERVVDAILDWRDPDDFRRPRGAERSEYLAGGGPALPDNGPFYRLSDLRHVRGMTSELYKRAQPFLILHGTGRVNLNTADRPVLLALPGMTEESAAVLTDLRQSGRRLSRLEDLPPLLSSGARSVLMAEYARLWGRISLETLEVEVRSSAWVPGDPVRTRSEGLVIRNGETASLVAASRH